MSQGIETELREAGRSIAGVVAPGLLAAVTERAAAAGLLDVAYARVDSPVGPLTVAGTDRGLLRVAFASQSVDEVLDEISARVSPRILEAPGRLDGIRRELDAYFAGTLRTFATPLDWSLSRGFYLEVLKATARIGYGRLSSYAEVAATAGSPRAVRAAGTGLGSNPIPVVVPCHRVLRSGGKLGGYAG
ncbi:MAG: methylated-DNA--[protein]-cysteine S-methyltransferase, partial [Thermoleophilaceae bacterium]